MNVVRADGPIEHAITDYASAGAWLLPVCEYDASTTTRVQMVRFEPGGTIGPHPTGFGQVFAVVDGSGWVRGGDGTRVEVVAGDVVEWETGEDHESGTTTGMLVCIVQTRRRSDRE